MVLGGWFGRKKQGALQDEEPINNNNGDDDDDDLGGGLGGFGAVDSFNTEPIVDPRADLESSNHNNAPQQSRNKPFEAAFPPPPEQPLQEQTSSFAADFSSSAADNNNTTQDSAFGGQQHYNSDSSSSDEEEDEEEDDYFPDDMSSAVSTVAGPLFDESKYSAADNDDEMTVDSYATSTEDKWRQKKANDFLSGFFNDDGESGSSSTSNSPKKKKTALAKVLEGGDADEPKPAFPNDPSPVPAFPDDVKPLEEQAATTEKQEPANEAPLFPDDLNPIEKVVAPGSPSSRSSKSSRSASTSNNDEEQEEQEPLFPDDAMNPLEKSQHAPDSPSSSSKSSSRSVASSSNGDEPEQSEPTFPDDMMSSPATKASAPVAPPPVTPDEALASPASSTGRSKKSQSASSSSHGDDEPELLLEHPTITEDVMMMNSPNEQPAVFEAPDSPAASSKSSRSASSSQEDDEPEQLDDDAEIIMSATTNEPAAPAFDDDDDAPASPASSRASSQSASSTSSHEEDEPEQPPTFTDDDVMMMNYPNEPAELEAPAVAPDSPAASSKSSFSASSSQEEEDEEPEPLSLADDAVMNATNKPAPAFDDAPASPASSCASSRASGRVSSRSTSSSQEDGDDDDEPEISEPPEQQPSFQRDDDAPASPASSKSNRSTASSSSPPPSSPVPPLATATTEPEEPEQEDDSSSSASPPPSPKQPPASLEDDKDDTNVDDDNESAVSPTPAPATDTFTQAATLKDDEVEPPNAATTATATAATSTPTSKEKANIPNSPRRMAPLPQLASPNKAVCAGKLPQEDDHDEDIERFQVEATSSKDTFASLGTFADASDNNEDNDANDSDSDNDDKPESDAKTARQSFSSFGTLNLTSEDDDDEPPDIDDGHSGSDRCCNDSDNEKDHNDEGGDEEEGDEFYKSDKSPSFPTRRLSNDPRMALSSPPLVMDRQKSAGSDVTPATDDDAKESATVNPATANSASAAPSTHSRRRRHVQHRGSIESCSTFTDFVPASRLDSNDVSEHDDDEEEEEEDHISHVSEEGSDDQSDRSHSSLGEDDEHHDVDQPEKSQDDAMSLDYTSEAFLHSDDLEEASHLENSDFLCYDSDDFTASTSGGRGKQWPRQTRRLSTQTNQTGNTFATLTEENERDIEGESVQDNDYLEDESDIQNSHAFNESDMGAVDDSRYSTEYNRRQKRSSFKKKKSRRHFVSDDSDVSDPDEPESGFISQDRATQQGAMNDEEASSDAKPSKPRRTASVTLEPVTESKNSGHESLSSLAASQHGSGSNADEAGHESMENSGLFDNNNDSQPSMPLRRSSVDHEAIFNWKSPRHDVEPENDSVGELGATWTGHDQQAAETISDGPNAKDPVEDDVNNDSCEQDGSPSVSRGTGPVVVCDAQNDEASVSSHSSKSLDASSRHTSSHASDDNASGAFEQEPNGSTEALMSIAAEENKNKAFNDNDNVSPEVKTDQRLTRSDGDKYECDVSSRHSSSHDDASLASDQEAKDNAQDFDTLGAGTKNDGTDSGDSGCASSTSRQETNANAESLPTIDVEAKDEDEDGEPSSCASTTSGPEPKAYAEAFVSFDADSNDEADGSRPRAIAKAHDVTNDAEETNDNDEPEDSALALSSVDSMLNHDSVERNDISSLQKVERSADELRNGDSPQSDLSEVKDDKVTPTDDADKTLNQKKGWRSWFGKKEDSTSEEAQSSTPDEGNGDKSMRDTIGSATDELNGQPHENDASTKQVIVDEEPEKSLVSDLDQTLEAVPTADDMAAKMEEHKREELYVSSERDDSESHGSGSNGDYPSSTFSSLQAKDLLGTEASNSPEVEGSSASGDVVDPPLGSDGEPKQPSDVSIERGESTPSQLESEKVPTMALAEEDTQQGKAWRSWFGKKETPPPQQQDQHLEPEEDKVESEAAENVLPACADTGNDEKGVISTTDKMQDNQAGESSADARGQIGETAAASEDKGDAFPCKDNDTSISGESNDESDEHNQSKVHILSDSWHDGHRTEPKGPQDGENSASSLGDDDPSENGGQRSHRNDEPNKQSVDCKTRSDSTASLPVSEKMDEDRDTEGGSPTQKRGWTSWFGKKENAVSQQTQSSTSSEDDDADRNMPDVDECQADGRVDQSNLAGPSVTSKEETNSTAPEAADTCIIGASNDDVEGSGDDESRSNSEPDDESKGASETDELECGSEPNNESESDDVNHGSHPNEESALALENDDVSHGSVEAKDESEVANDDDDESHGSDLDDERSSVGKGRVDDASHISESNDKIAAANDDDNFFESFGEDRSCSSHSDREMVMPSEKQGGLAADTDLKPLGDTVKDENASGHESFSLHSSNDKATTVLEMSTNFDEAQEQLSDSQYFLMSRMTFVGDVIDDDTDDDLEPPPHFVDSFAAMSHQAESSDVDTSSVEVGDTLTNKASDSQEQENSSLDLGADDMCGFDNSSRNTGDDNESSSVEHDNSQNSEDTSQVDKVTDWSEGDPCQTTPLQNDDDASSCADGDAESAASSEPKTFPQSFDDNDGSDHSSHNADASTMKHEDSQNLGHASAIESSEGSSNDDRLPEQNDWNESFGEGHAAPPQNDNDMQGDNFSAEDKDSSTASSNLDDFQVAFAESGVSEHSSKNDFDDTESSSVNNTDSQNIWSETGATASPQKDDANSSNFDNDDGMSATFSQPGDFQPASDVNGGSEHSSQNACDDISDVGQNDGTPVLAQESWNGSFGDSQGNDNSGVDSEDASAASSQPESFQPAVGSSENSEHSRQNTRDDIIDVPAQDNWNGSFGDSQDNDCSSVDNDDASAASSQLESFQPAVGYNRNSEHSSQKAGDGNESSSARIEDSQNGTARTPTLEGDRNNASEHDHPPLIAPDAGPAKDDDEDDRSDTFLKTDGSENSSADNKDQLPEYSGEDNEASQEEASVQPSDKQSSQENPDEKADIESPPSESASPKKEVTKTESTASPRKGWFSSWLGKKEQEPSENVAAKSSEIESKVKEEHVSENIESDSTHEKEATLQDASEVETGFNRSKNDDDDDDGSAGPSTSAPQAASFDKGGSDGAVAPGEPADDDSFSANSDNDPDASQELASSHLAFAKPLLDDGDDADSFDQSQSENSDVDRNIECSDSENLNGAQDRATESVPDEIIDEGEGLFDDQPPPSFQEDDPSCSVEDPKNAKCPGDSNVDPSLDHTDSFQDSTRENSVDGSDGMEDANEGSVRSDDDDDNRSIERDDDSEASSKDDDASDAIEHTVQITADGDNDSVNSSTHIDDKVESMDDHQAEDDNDDSGNLSTNSTSSHEHKDEVKATYNGDNEEDDDDDNLSVDSDDSACTANIQSAQLAFAMALLNGDDVDMDSCGPSSDDGDGDCSLGSDKIPEKLKEEHQSESQTEDLSPLENPQDEPQSVSPKESENEEPITSQDDEVTQGETKVVNVDKNESDEDESESSSSDEDSCADSEHSEQDDDPRQLVIKEAPLLRLENVTSTTRSKIPASKIERQRGNGWGGWLKGWRQDAQDAQDAKGRGDQSETQNEGTPAASSEAATETSQDADKDEIPESKVAATHAQDSKQADPEDKPFSSAVSPDETPGSATLPDEDIVKNENKQQSKPEDGGESTQGVGSLKSVDAAVAEPKVEANTKLSKEEPSEKKAKEGKKDKTKKSKKHKKEKKPKKEKKEKNDKSKSGLSSHFGKSSVRKIGRHGDEVSVGTMELSKKSKKAKSSRGQQHVVLATGANLFDDASHDASKEARPWEKALAKNKGPKMKESTLGANTAILEESEGSDENNDVAGTSDAFGTDLGFGTMDTFDSFDAFDDALSSIGREKENDDDDDEDSAPNAELPDDDSTHNEEQLDSPEKGSLSILESTLASDKPDPDGVDFDDMWDTLSADVSTAQEYERKQRENFRRKKGKKKYTREKKEAASDKKTNEVQNLKLFEATKGSQSRRNKKKQEKMSTQFLSAIREVFDEESEGSDQDEESVSENLEDSVGELEDDDSVVSNMYLGGEKSDKAEGSEASGAADDANENDSQSQDEDNNDGGSHRFGFGSDDGSNSRASSRRGKRSMDDSSRSRSSGRRSTTSSRSRRSTTSSRSRSSRRSSSSKPKTPKVNPSEILEAELKRSKGGSKVMSISSLKQEMSDRRGTSVNLLKKEYDQRKKQKAKETLQSSSSGRGMHQIDFGNADNKNLGVDSFVFDKKNKQKDDFFGGSDDFPSKETNGGNSEKAKDKLGGLSDHLSNHLSRWDAGGSVSELDDLKTIQVDVNNDLPSGIMLGLNAGLHTAGLPDLPGMPPPISLPTLPEDKEKTDGSSAFATGFDDMPLTMVTESFEEHDDNEQGLLASNDDWMDNEDMESVSSKKKGNRLLSLKSLKGPKLGGSMKMKGPKIGGSLKKIGTFIPKRSQSSRGGNGWTDDGDDDASCLLGG